FLKMKTDEVSNFMIESDFRELGVAAQKLANHAFEMGLGMGFGTTFFKFFAAVAAIYLLVLDHTNWKTNMLTSLLIPYIF
ncbi:hypothetical protein, partial [Mycobacterium tuberculosis]|uniref:hypothetical protein n=1 Tax=Mycobacterium tuberculosis TaxID=1773 RepID=UPI0025519426